MQMIHSNISDNRHADKLAMRNRYEVLNNRIDLLDGRDKLIMGMYLHNGISIYKISRLSGISESTLSRRIRQLSYQLTEGEYAFCLKNRRRLSAREMDIAGDYYLKKVAMKRIADEKSVSYYYIVSVKSLDIVFSILFGHRQL